MMNENRTNGSCRSRTVTYLARLTIATMLVGIVCDSAPAQDANQSNGPPDELRGHIAQLIEKLSDPSYSTRLRAQGELERIGVLALDQLHAASFHADPQIASTARYVVQSNQFSWSWDTDPVNVRQILSNYGAADSDKSIYIDQLQRLEHDEGFAALCRLVRYETRSGLAKRAALLLMRSRPTVGQSLDRRKEALSNFVGGGQSQASRWLVKYATNEKEFDQKWWDQAIANELQQLKAGSVETNLDLVIDLHKWVAEQTFDVAELRTYSLSIARSILTLSKTVPTLDSMIGNRSTRANEFAQWALKYKLPELVQEQHAKLPSSIVSREFMFGYLLAESFLLQGNRDLANTIAEHSLNQVPCSEMGIPKTADADVVSPFKGGAELTARANANNQDIRSSLGQKLQERGQFKWAEAEFRLALNDDLTNYSTLICMRRLSTMLQIQSKHSQAADVLEPFVARYNSEPMFKRQVNEFFREHTEIISNFHLYVGDDARQSNEVEKAAKNYWLSIELEPENVDAIVGLYRLSLTDKEKERLRRELANLIAKDRVKIRAEEEQLKLSSPGDRASYSGRLAMLCNNLAWLIANTEGSKEEALFLSRKACNLAPEDAENLDTLAYCYAALERYQDAVEQQRRAVALKPHHPELAKALHRFEAKLRSSQP